MKVSRDKAASLYEKDIADGLSRRITALSKITDDGVKIPKDDKKWYHYVCNWDGKTYGDREAIRTFIMLLLILIELSPILMKMMMKNGVYDDIMEHEDNFSKFKRKIEKENLRLKLNNGRLLNKSDEIMGVDTKEPGFWAKLKFRLFKHNNVNNMEGNIPTEHRDANDSHIYTAQKNYELFTYCVDDVSDYLKEKISSVLTVQDNDTPPPPPSNDQTTQNKDASDEAFSI